VKDLSTSFAAIVALALALGLLFHWAYPMVELGPQLAALFVFVAVLLRLALARLWQWVRRSPMATGSQGSEP
jgi:hypothetical protein